ncbi:hypothetical protein BGZ76_006660, partial [Entomortierella beljakovae]
MQTNPTAPANSAHPHNFQALSRIQESTKMQSMTIPQQQLQESAQMPMQMQLQMQMQMQMQLQQQLQQQQQQQQQRQQLLLQQPSSQPAMNFSPQTFSSPSQLYQTFPTQGTSSFGVTNAASAIPNPQGLNDLDLGTNPQPIPPILKKDIWAAQQANLQAQLNKNNLNAVLIAGGGMDTSTGQEKLQQLLQFQQRIQLSNSNSTVGSVESMSSKISMGGGATAVTTPIGHSTASHTIGKLPHILASPSSTTRSTSQAPPLAGVPPLTIT